MKTIVYSKDGKYYYIKELVCPRCNWISVEKFNEKPEKGWISHAYQYDDDYFRSALPFTFWKVKSGNEAQIDDNHELVKDYIDCGHTKR